MIKIVFFAPYPDILPVIEQVFRERPESEAIQYEVVQDFYNNRLEQVEAEGLYGPYLKAQKHSVCRA